MNTQPSELLQNFTIASQGIDIPEELRKAVLCRSIMIEEESDEETRDAYLSDFKILAKV